MNPNFDFRSSEIWDDRSPNDSIGEAMKRCTPIDLAATIWVALCMILVVLS